MAAQHVLTPFAKRYGESTFTKDGRSRLTPVMPPFVGDSSTPGVQNLLNDYRYSYQSQTKYLLDFTSRELSDLDAICIDRSLKSSTLKDVVLPIFEPGFWEDDIQASTDPKLDRTFLLTCGPYPYLYKVPEISKVIRPCLVLATRIFEAAKYSDFFKTWLLGNEKPINPNILPSGPVAADLLTRMVPKPVAATSSEMDQRLEEIMRIMKRRFGLAFADCSKFRSTGGRADGMTIPYHVRVGEGQNQTKTLLVSTYIDIKIVEVLLREDLSDAERMGLQMAASVTIFHELIHAMDVARHFSVHGDTSQVRDIEVFYRDEQIVELGYSCLHHVLGGIMRHMYGGDIPFGFWYHTGWPTSFDIYDSYLPNQVLTHPPMGDTSTAYPIPVSVYENVFRQEFWDVAVQRYGLESVFDGARGPGTSIKSSLISNDVNTTRLLNDWWTKAPNQNSRGSWESRLNGLNYKLSLKPDDRAAMKFLEDLVDTTNQGEVIWNLAVQLDERIVHVTQAKFDIDKFLVNLNDIVRLHRDMAIHTLRMERGENIYHYSRRNNLLIFNRGLQSFLQRLLIERPQDRGPIETTIKGLDFSRLLLVDPRDTRMKMNGNWDTKDWDNFERIGFLEDHRMEQQGINDILSEYQHLFDYNQILAGTRHEDYCWFDFVCVKLLRASVSGVNDDSDRQLRRDLALSCKREFKEIEIELNARQHTAEFVYPPAWSEFLSLMEFLYGAVAFDLGV